LGIDARQCTAASVHPGDGTPRRFFFQAQIRLPYTRGSVRRASGFVLTGNPEIIETASRRTEEMERR